VHTLHDEELKQEMKEMIWHVGNVLKILKNASIIEQRYHRVGHFIISNAFLKLKYLNSELIGAIIDFDNVASADLEKRTDAKATTRKKKPVQAQNWSDLYRLSFHDAISK
jgi:hypothetical protein